MKLSLKPWAARFCDTIDDLSPYNGSMLFTVQLSVHSDVIDDECVVSIMGRDGAHIAKRTSPTGFENEAAIADAIRELLELEQTFAPEQLQPVLAMHGTLNVPRVNWKPSALQKRWRAFDPERLPP